MFQDRQDAGKQLGEAIAELDLDDPVIFGIPRGGVIVAAEAAKIISAELDVIVPAKVRAPYQKELGLGAVTSDGTTYLDEETIRILGVTKDYLNDEIRQRAAEILRRTLAYRGERSETEVTNRSAILVDDGIATGGTAIAAARSVRKRGPKSLILAVPVAPSASVSKLATEVDKVVSLSTPEPFIAVGRWYRDFDEVTDDEVRAVLQQGVNS